MLLREQGHHPHLPICFSLTLSHMHKSLSSWLLTLTLLFLCCCFFAEASQGGRAAPEGTWMARWCDGKVGHTLLSLLLRDVVFLISRQTGLSFVVCPLPSVFPFSAQFSYFTCISLMTMWSASQRQCGNKNLIIFKWKNANTVPQLCTHTIIAYFWGCYFHGLQCNLLFCFTGYRKLNNASFCSWPLKTHRSTLEI